MAFVSILLPAFYFEDGSEISNQVSRQLGMKESQFELCRVLPPYSIAEPQFEEYAVKLLHSDLNIHKIEMLLEEQNITSKKVEKCKEALTTLSREFNNLVHNPDVLKEVDNQKLAKRTKKLKQIKEDNKKLRYLLKVHMDNSEKMRIETQTTIETLREEFDLLVKELSNLQKGASEQNNSDHANGIELQNSNAAAAATYSQVPPISSHHPDQHLQQQYQQQQYQRQQQLQYRQDPRLGQQQPAQFNFPSDIGWYQLQKQQQPASQQSKVPPFTAINVTPISTNQGQPAFVSSNTSTSASSNTLFTNSQSSVNRMNARQAPNNAPGFPKVNLQQLHGGGDNGAAKYP